jgi:CRP/FNR family transcriptional regulator, cyclic AMP receptor protein
MKAPDPKVALLRSLPSLAGARVRDLAEVAPLVDEVRVEPGTVLTREGDTCHEVALIVEGRATLMAGGRVSGILGPGDLLGDIALLDGSPHHTTAVAATQVRLLVAGPETNRALIGHPALLQCATSSLAGRLRRRNEEASSKAR